MSYYTRFKRDNPTYYPATPSYAKTVCPVDYCLENCSSFDEGYCCRTCANYNPVRILIDYKNNETGVPFGVLYEDAQTQLKNFVR